MGMRGGFLREYDNEMSTTRRILARVPLEHAGWQPHPKSMSLGELAGHIVDMTSWVPAIVESPAYDIAAERTSPKPAFTSVDDLLATFDYNVAKGRTIIGGASDGELLAHWRLEKNGQEIFSAPRIGILRSFLLNHIIHHRGQLSVYLRLRDVPVPSIYGPSADEATF